MAIAVGGDMFSAEASVTPSTTAYDAGDAMGGRLTFSFINPFDEGGGLIVSSVLMDRKKDNSSLTLTLFDKAISTGGSTVTDNAALAIGDTDLSHAIGAITFSTGDYVSYNATSIAFDNSQVGYYIENGRTLYGCLRVNGTPTCTSGNSITVKLFAQREPF